MLEGKDITVRHGDTEVLHGCSVAFDAGQITAVIGPNGCGKSTLLRALSGVQDLAAGQVLLEGRDIARLGRRQIAQALALLPQSPQAPAGLTVRDLVAHGRYAHSRAFAGLSVADHQAIDTALEQTQTAAWAERPFDALSGGERQRVWIALALAQAPRLLLLDEPTSYLDMGHQEELLHLLSGLRGKGGPGLVMVLHDLNQASRFANRVIVMEQGALIADGPPAEVLSAALIRRLYGLEVSAHGTRGGAPVFLPYEISAREQ